jgi:Spx/MgsR family transcriptional regulator
MYIIYGIPNCDTIKKTLTWLKANNITYEFHDYKKQNITADKLKTWSKQIGWENFLNKKSTTWRELDAAMQAKIINEKAAIKLMTENTSIIKRPIIELNETVVAVGFDENSYKTIFAKN